MSTLEITKVRVNKVKEHAEGASDKVVALATILLNDTFAINKIRVINGVKGLFVSMPRNKNGKGEWEDVCHPLTGEFRKSMDKLVLDEYNKLKD